MPGRWLSLPPGFELCRAVHVRPSGERVACMRRQGHHGMHCGRAEGVPEFTWIDPTALEKKEHRP